MLLYNRRLYGIESERIPYSRYVCRDAISDGEGQMWVLLVIAIFPGGFVPVKLFVVIFEFGSGLILGELEYEFIFFAYAMMSVERPMGDCSVFDTVAFIVYGAPEHVFQSVYSHTGYGRYEYMRKVVGQFALHLCYELIIKKVGLADGEYSGFVDEVGVELFEFAKQNLILLADVVGIGRHHEEQYGVRSI